MISKITKISGPGRMAGSGQGKQNGSSSVLQPETGYRYCIWRQMPKGSFNEQRKF
jgi:hypothetical protein